MGPNVLAVVGAEQTAAVHEAVIAELAATAEVVVAVAIVVAAIVVVAIVAVRLHAMLAVLETGPLPSSGENRSEGGV
jgi:hypothetical protein